MAKQTQRKAVTISRFAANLGAGEATAYRWARRGLLRVEKGKIAGDAAQQCRRDWKRSCTQVKAAALLHVSPTTVGIMLSEGELNGLRMFGKVRVLLSSVEDAKRRPRAIAPDDIVFPTRRGFARLSAA